MDGDVVGAIAGEPVDLVGLDVLDHLHQCGTVGFAGGLAGVDELGHDLRAEGLGLAMVGLALGGDGEPFVSAALLGLLTGGDPQVGDGGGGVGSLLGVDPQRALQVLADATAGDAALIPEYVSEMFRLIPRLTKLSKPDQRAMAAWQRDWTQAALKHGATSPPPQRRL